MTGKDLKHIGIDTPEHEFCANDDEGAGILTPDIDDMTPEHFDTYVGAEVNLPLYGEQGQGMVTARAWDSAGKLFGKANSNPILDMRIYQVDFPDGNMLNTLLMSLQRTCSHNAICWGTSSS